MKIGELADRCRVSVRSLRYYEERGLLSPGRDASGHRLFATADVERVSVIQELYAAGFCSGVVRDLLPALTEPGARDEAWISEQLVIARRRLERERNLIGHELERLAEVRARLGLAPDTHVRDEAAGHDDTDAAPPAPADHRDRRLR